MAGNRLASSGGFINSELAPLHEAVELSPETTNTQVMSFKEASDAMASRAGEVTLDRRKLESDVVQKMKAEISETGKQVLYIS